MRIFPISLSYQAVVAGRLSHPAANPLRLTLRMRDGESLAAPCVLRAELHTSRFLAANTTPLAVATAAASPFQGEWNLDFSSAQMNQPTPPEGVRKLWLVVYATEGSTILYTFAGIDVDLGWHAISQVTPPPPYVPLMADVGGRGWQTGWQYEAETLVVNGTTPYVSLSAHTSSSATEPGVGADWATVWQAAAGGPFTDLTVSGTLTAPHIHGNLAGSVYTHVRNESGGVLAKGTPVYVTGYSVGQSRPLVAAANAANAANMPAIGILDEELANNASGHCVISGGITDINTAAYSVNEPLYVASGGGLTATAPSTLAQPIAIVERVNANNGSIIVTAAGTRGSLSNQSAANVAITGGTIFGLGTPGASALTTIGDVSFTGSTASTSTTSGALVVTGGVGIGGAVNIGGNLAASGTASFTSATAGAVSTSADITVNGVRVGRGVGNQTTSLAFGLNAGNSQLSGTPATQEVAVGNVALSTAHSGSGNCAVGSNSMQSLSGSSSASNTAIGTSSMLNIQTSSNSNVAAGANAGRYAGSGTGGTNILCSSSVFIGTASRPAASGQTNQIVIGGLNAIGDGSDTTVIGTTGTTQSRLFGGNALTTGANGQSTQLGQSTVLLTGLTGATITAAALIPANSIVIGVTARVTTAITGATSFDIGDGATANLFGDDVAVAVGTTSANTIAPTRYAAATNIVLTANGGNFSAGAVRLTVHFLTLVAPTS